MTSCQCQIPLPETQLLQADEGWHCLQCGWPVADDDERVKREVQIRELARKIGVGPDAPIVRAIRNTADAAALREAVADLEASIAHNRELDRLVQRSRMIARTGLACTLILIALSAAQVFGLFGHSLVAAISIGFGVGSMTVLAILNFVNMRRALR